MQSTLYSLLIFAQSQQELSDEEKAAIVAAVAIIVMIVLGLFAFYNLLLLISFYAFRRKQGFWGNTICVFNISFATIIAVGFHESLAALLTGLYPGLLFYYELLTFMLLFWFSYFMLFKITNRLSQVKVRFPVPVEVGGNILVLLMCFGYFYGMMVAASNVMPAGIAPVFPSAPVLQVSMLSQGPLQPIFGGNPMGVIEYTERKMAHHAEHKKNAESGNKLYDGSAPPRAER